MKDELLEMIRSLNKRLEEGRCKEVVEVKLAIERLKRTITRYYYLNKI